MEENFPEERQLPSGKRDSQYEWSFLIERKVPSINRKGA